MHGPEYFFVSSYQWQKRIKMDYRVPRNDQPELCCFVSRDHWWTLSNRCYISGRIDGLGVDFVEGFVEDRHADRTNVKLPVCALTAAGRICVVGKGTKHFLNVTYYFFFFLVIRSFFFPFVAHRSRDARFFFFFRKVTRSSRCAFPPPDLAQTARDTLENSCRYSGIPSLTRTRFGRTDKYCTHLWKLRFRF